MFVLFAVLIATISVVIFIVQSFVGVIFIVLLFFNSFS